MIKRLINCFREPYSFSALNIFAIPLILCGLTVYDAALSLLALIALVAISIGVCLLLEKFALVSYKMPIVLMLSGAFSVAIETLSDGLSDNMQAISLAAFICSAVFAYRFEDCKLSIGKRLLLSVKNLGVLAAILVASALIRELLSSGSLFVGFTEKGLCITPLNLPAISQSWSCLLILSVVFFVACRFVKGKEVRLQGITHATIVSSVISFVSAIGYYWLIRLDLGSVAPMLVLLLCALLMISLKTLSSGLNAEYICLSVMFCIFALDLSQAFVAYLIELSLLIIIITACAFVAEFSTKHKGLSGIPSSLVFASACAYLANLFIA